MSQGHGTPPRVAFDVTGVIQGQWGKHAASLALALLAAGWEVFILSPNRPDTIRADCDAAGFPMDRATLINRGDKGKACAEYAIDIFIDDDPAYLRQVMDDSPTTMPLWRSNKGDVAKRWF